jgi:hypothetical protein
MFKILSYLKTKILLAMGLGTGAQSFAEGRISIFMVRSAPVLL